MPVTGRRATEATSARWIRLSHSMHDTMSRRHLQRLGPLRRHAAAWGWLVIMMGWFAPSALRGQLSVMQMEVNGGSSIPVADFAGVAGWEGEASAGTSFGVHFALAGGHVGYLVGFSEHRFGCAEDACGAETDLVSTAWDLGLRINFRSSGVVPWMRVGAIAALLEVDLTSAPTGETATTVREESDRGWGFEAGAGVLIPVADRFGLSPGVRYGRVDLDLASRGVLQERYVVLDVAFVLGF